MTDSTDDFLARAERIEAAYPNSSPAVTLYRDEFRRLFRIAKAGRELYAAVIKRGCPLCKMQMQAGTLTPFHAEDCPVAAYEQTLADEKAVTE